MNRAWTSVLILLAACTGRAVGGEDAGIPDAHRSTDTAQDDAGLANDGGSDGGAPDDGGPVETGPLRTRWLAGGVTAHEAIARSVAIGPTGEVAVGGEFASSISLGATTLRNFDEVAPNTDAFIAVFEPGGALRWAASGGSTAHGLRESTLALDFEAGGDLYLLVRLLFATDEALATLFRPRFNGEALPLARSRTLVARLSETGQVVWLVPGGDAPDAIAELALDFGDDLVTLTDELAERAPDTGEPMRIPAPRADVLHAARGALVLAGRFAPGAHVALGGQTLLQEESGGNAWVGRIPESGDPWLRAVGGTNVTLGGVATDAAGNVYLAGCFEDAVLETTGRPEDRFGSDGSTDVLVASFSPLGEYRWARRAGGRDADCANAIAVDHGHVLVAGAFSDVGRFGRRLLGTRGGKDVFVASWSTAGEFEWVEQAGGPGDDEAHALASDGAGQLVIAGAYEGTARFGIDSLWSPDGISAFVWAVRLAEPPAGSCDGVDCAAAAGPCQSARCEEASGRCIVEAARETEPCEDGDRCTSGDACAAGACVPGARPDCSGMDGLCELGACDPATGACVARPRADGTACGVAPSECLAQACRAGVCEVGDALECTPCTGGVCSQGACGQSPSRLRWSMDEGLPGGWITGGDVPFEPSSRRAEGTGSLRSGRVGHGGTSTLAVRVTPSVPSILSFSALVSAADPDALELRIDGTLEGRWTHDDVRWRPAAVRVPSGAHEVEWRFVKDASGAGMLDGVWIDDVRLVAEPSGPGLESFEASGLPAGWVNRCTYYSWEETPCTALWAPGSSAAASGARAATLRTSGQGTHALQTSVTVSAPSTVQFWYRTDTLAPASVIDLFDTSWVGGELRFEGFTSTSGVGLLGTSGSNGWLHAELPLAPGTHQLRFVLENWYSTSEAWIDDFVIVPDEPALAICAP